MASRRHTNEFSRTGALAPETSLREGDGLTIFADAANAVELGRERSVAGALGAHLRRARPGDYVALLAFLEPNAGTEAELRAIRGLIRDRLHVATSLGLGPRYLHSTGQAYKGGPNTGVFLMVTADDVADVLVPTQKYSFGVVKAAQARGDLQVLGERGRRAVRVHIGRDVKAGLVALRTALERALA
jgi:transaldolase/glucose-6-phosphate isomerase